MLYLPATTLSAGIVMIAAELPGHRKGQENDFQESEEMELSGIHQYLTVCAGKVSTNS